MPATIAVRSRQREELLDITHEVAAAVKASEVTEGLCHLWCGHTTCGLTVNENADPDVQRDMLLALRHLIPVEGWPEQGEAFKHFEHNADAHLKASLMGFGLTVPIINSRLALGRWQAIYLAEFDGPRERQVTVLIR